MQEADAIAAAAGFRPLGTCWIPLAAEQALDHLTHCIHGHLAYSSVELVPRPSAEELARMFCAFFPHERNYYFTNQEAVGHDASAWTPLSDSTFDSGVVIIAQDLAGILWFEDED